MPCIETKVIAGGFVTGATGVFAGRGATVARTALGVYLVTTDQQIDPTQKIINATLSYATGGIINVTADADATVEFSTFDLPAMLAGGPAAADINFYFEIAAMDLI